MSSTQEPPEPDRSGTDPVEPGRTSGVDQYSSPAGFARLAQEFESLRVMPSSDREQALATLATADPGITTALRALLAQHDDDPDQMAAPDQAFDATMVASALSEAGDTAAAAPALPERIGPYRVLRRLGQGGMGSVYLAEHEDPDLRRQVAVKVLHRAQNDPDLVRRFRTERRILGALQHPNIAALFDGGATDDDQPYVAMEFVDGLDLLSHCDRHELATDARLQLFVKVCRATAHAHRSLIVHRDLKPSNVLVTADGEPKLLDFGIAKLLEHGPDGDAGAHPALTQTGSMLLTPEYSSPEQVRGDAITTATDVYALGALLYELLTGARAQRLTSGSMAELLQVVCDRTPQPPSTVVRQGPAHAPGHRETRTRRSRRLEGDLDTIVAAAMKKEPDRRYGSAAALADDLERHLRGLPVTARPDTLAYRTRKFVARNRLPVFSGALLLLLLLAFAIVTASDNRTIQDQLATIRTQTATIAAERDEAVTQNAVANRVVEFLGSLYEMAAPDPDRAETLRARELLDRGARRIESELGDLPAQRAPLQMAMGRAYLSLGLYQDAEPLLSAAEATLGRHRANRYSHREAQFLLGGLRMHLGDTERGEQLIRASWQAVSEGRPISAEVRAAREGALATWLRDQGRFDEALGLVHEARERFGSAGPGDMLDRIEATIRRDRGEFTTARDLLVGAIARGEQAVGPDRPRHATLYRELALVQQDLGDLDGALGSLQRALAIDRQWTGEQHPDIDTDLFSLAMVEIDRGELRVAEETLREILRRDTARFGERHAQTALTMGQLALVLGRLGNFDDAEAMLRRTLDLQRELLPEQHPELATTLANLATLYQRNGLLEPALPLYEEALAVRLARYAPEHPIVLTARQQLAVLELDRGNAEAAEVQFRSLLAARRTVRGHHSETAGSLLSLATCISRQGRHEEAIPLFEESTAMFRATLPAEHPTQARPLLGQAMALLQLDRAQDAEPLLREADEIRSAALGDEQFDTLYGRFCLLRCLVQQQKFAAARELARANVPLMRAHFPDNRLTIETERLLASLPE